MKIALNICLLFAVCSLVVARSHHSHKRHGKHHSKTHNKNRVHWKTDSSREENIKEGREARDPEFKDPVAVTVGHQYFKPPRKHILTDYFLMPYESSRANEVTFEDEDEPIKEPRHRPIVWEPVQADYGDLGIPENINFGDEIEGRMLNTPEEETEEEMPTDIDVPEPRFYRKHKTVTKHKYYRPRKQSQTVTTNANIRDSKMNFFISPKRRQNTPTFPKIPTEDENVEDFAVEDRRLHMYGESRERSDIFSEEADSADRRYINVDTFSDENENETKSI